MTDDGVHPWKGTQSKGASSCSTYMFRHNVLLFLEKWIKYQHQTPTRHITDLQESQLELGVITFVLGVRKIKMTSFLPRRCLSVFDSSETLRSNLKVIIAGRDLEP